MSLTPSFTITNEAVEVPNYGITVTTQYAAGILTVFVGVDYRFTPETNDKRRIENVMVWVAGELVLQAFDWNNIPRGFAFVSTSPTPTRREYTFTIPRRLIVAPAGPNTVTVSLWDSGFLAGGQAGGSPGGIAYVNTVVDLPAEPLPAIKPGKILRGLFVCNPGNLTAVDRQAVKDAGANCFECQLFNNPRNATTTFEQWKPQWESLVGARLQIAKDMGMLVIGAGDDFARDTGAYAWTRDTSWAADAIAYVSQRCLEFGNVTCIEVQDEVGTNAINDPVYQKIRAAWTSVPGYVPMGWPSLALANNTPLEVPSFGDYITRYVDPGVVVWRHGRPYQHTFWTDALFLKNRTTNINYSRPVGINGGCMGPFYNKRVEGSNYQPGDDLIALGSSASDIVAHAWLTMAYRSSMLRLYAWDFSPQSRANAAIGANGLQTGCRPGDDRWPGVVAAFQSIAQFEQLLLGPAYPPVTYGPWVVGRRDGLSWAVNITESPATWDTPGTLVTNAGMAPFAGGTVPPGGVVVSGGTTPAPLVIVVDDTSPAGFTKGSGWTYQPNPGGYPYYGGTHHYKDGRTGSADPCVWKASLLPGRYRIGVYYVPYSNRATDAAYTVQDGVGNVLLTKTVNQQLAPGDFQADGKGWATLGEIVLAVATEVSVLLSGRGNQYLIADAVRFDRVGG